MNLNRVWEMLTRTPHIHANANMVKSAMNALAMRTEEFSNAIKPYSESRDPLFMLVKDLFDQRSSGMARRDNGKTKLLP